MKSQRPLTIAGGGLAGLSLGIALQNQGIPATLIEAGHYPRHRVCGEFLSGIGQDILEELGVLPACLQAGARWARTVRFATQTGIGAVHHLPRPAFCLSRHRMDALLADEFQQRGGILRLGERAPDTTGQEGWVRASGRRIAPTDAPWRWFGIKAHAQGVTLSADLELHVSSSAYVGLCRLDADRTNICGLFRRRSGEATTGPCSPLDWLRGPEGSPWRERIRSAIFDPDSLCTTGGLDLRMRPCVPPNSIYLGDAFAIIPPLTGNGMSLALESSHEAVAALVAYANGAESWARTCDRVQRGQRRAFGQRLLWAGILQRLLFAPIVPSLLFRVLHRSDQAWRALFAITRA